jgi:L-amino acid N-acyltransferase YncA
MEVRPAAAADAAAMQAVYAHHVLHGTGTFELVPPDMGEMARRWQAVTGAGQPWLVAVDTKGRVLGYAYAASFRARPAYRYTLEDSVYVAPAAAGRGVGTALLARLIAISAEDGYRQMLAVIGDSANAASIALHERFGFRHAGAFRSVGFKFGRWLDTVQMQRDLGDGDRSPGADP